MNFTYLLPYLFAYQYNFKYSYIHVILFLHLCVYFYDLCICNKTAELLRSSLRHFTHTALGHFTLNNSYYLFIPARTAVYMYILPSCMYYHLQNQTHAFTLPTWKKSFVFSLCFPFCHQPKVPLSPTTGSECSKNFSRFGPPTGCLIGTTACATGSGKLA